MFVVSSSHLCLFLQSWIYRAELLRVYEIDDGEKKKKKNKGNFCLRMLPILFPVHFSLFEQVRKSTYLCVKFNCLNLNY